MAIQSGDLETKPVALVVSDVEIDEPIEEQECYFR